MRRSISTILVAAILLGWPGLGGMAPAPRRDPSPQQCYAAAVLSLAYIKEQTGPILTMLEDAMNASASTPQQRASARAQWEEGTTFVRDAEGLLERWRPSGHVPNDRILGVLEGMSEAEVEIARSRCVAMAPPAGPPARSTRDAADFTREDGVDRFGNDLRMIEMSPRDIDACTAACRADTRCRAFTLYTPPPADKSFCWLKHAAGERRQAPHVSSGLRIP